MMQYRMHHAEGILGSYVRFFWTLEAHVEGREPFIHRTLPDNCVELIFYCKGKLAISSLGVEEGNTFTSGVFGQSQKFKQFKTENDFTLFGVYLYPYTLKMLFGLPAHHISNVRIDSEQLWGIKGKILEEQIIMAHSYEQRISLASNFFLERIKTIGDHEMAFVRQIKSVVDNNSLHSIASFAHHCNLSRRQFERKLKMYSGFSPKEFFNIIRFKNVLKEIEQKNKSLAQVAMNAGYYDQSHFTNEFKKMSGYNPREFVLHYPEAIDMRATRDFKE